jgi:ABC-2 type transport system ATP-binding protein
MISISSVSKSYGEKTVLEGVDLEIGGGRIFGLLGPNGAGKTTLLNILSCQIGCTGGEARLDGLSISKDASSIRARIGLVPQEAALYGKLTVGENLAFMGALHGMNGAALARSVESLLGELRLSASAGLRAEHCSSGMRQALNIAMGIIHEPKIILLDEPTEGLDPAVRRAVWGLLQDLAAQGRTLLLTTHIMHEAERYCDEVAFLHAGRVLAVGTPEEVRKECLALTRTAPGEAREEGRQTLEDVFIELLGEDG